ncbi:MAG TPA: bifunctional oligoribonuclease/PAP phosphatase NrnA [Rectinemataceae bacterium]|nr:bifunctional oligoribonuclease/PAP phosphatase NrnA [Rectinemataceae bacterium]
MTLDDFADQLKSHDKYLVLSHDGPDADGLGSAYALVIALRSIGKRAMAAVSDQLPAKFRFIDRQGLFVSLATEAGFGFPPEEATVIVVDTHDLHYLGARGAELLKRCARHMVIDHHEARSAPGPLLLLESEASSTCELVYLLARSLGAEVPEDAAEALFAGMVYDTGSFAYAKTGERTFACARELVALGAKPYKIHREMYESSSVAVLILQKMVFASLELFAEDRIAVQTLRRTDLSASGANYEDAEDLVNRPLIGGTIEVSILFKENLEGRLRCSLRSKGRVNVARIAQSYGGGGHKTAAGFTCPEPLERIKDDVLQSIGKALTA